MDVSLKNFSSKTHFGYDSRIINIFNAQGIQYTRRDDTITFDNKSFVKNVFLNNNTKVFVELENIVGENGYLYFDNPAHYYRYFTALIFSFGNLEMIEFLQNRFDLNNLLGSYFGYLAYRFDDNAEIVHAVLSKLNKDFILPYKEIAFKAAEEDNINIFKYIYNQSPTISFSSKKKSFVWSKFNIEFLDFFLSESLFSEKDIAKGVKVVDTNDKIKLVLSYVESGRLKLRDGTIGLLNYLLNKN
jgi:hypothetical protein